jgi:hypothetical protein
VNVSVWLVWEWEAGLVSLVDLVDDSVELMSLGLELLDRVIVE